MTHLQSLAQLVASQLRETLPHSRSFSRPSLVKHGCLEVFVIVPSNNWTRETIGAMVFLGFATTDVLNCSDLAPSLSTMDGIPPKLLLEIVEQISIPLATVFNLSLEEGIVPLEWKEANIIPLFKKGSRNKSENYRPVSLTSVICKLLERLIKDHLVNFLVKNKLINPSQHGFFKSEVMLNKYVMFFGRCHKVAR